VEGVHNVNVVQALLDIVELLVFFIDATEHLHFEVVQDAGQLIEFLDVVLAIDKVLGCLGSADTSDKRITLLELRSEVSGLVADFFSVIGKSIDARDDFGVEGVVVGRVNEGKFSQINLILNQEVSDGLEFGIRVGKQQENLDIVEEEVIAVFQEGNEGLSVGEDTFND